MTAKLVMYAVTPDGYEVNAYDGEMQPVQEYRSGNNPHSSAPEDSLDPDDDRALSIDRLREDALKTAQDMAAELGLGEDAVLHDADLEANLMEEREARRTALAL